MAPRRPERLTPLELEIMKVLWTAGPGGVQSVRDALAPRRKLAYTTVQTMLNVLLRKGRVRRRSSLPHGRARQPRAGAGGGRERVGGEGVARRNPDALALSDAARRRERCRRLPRLSGPGLRARRAGVAPHRRVAAGCGRV